MSSTQQDMHDVQDEHHDHEHDSGNDRMEDLDVDDEGFADMHDLAPLVTRIAELETQFTTMNESLSTMSTLMNQIIRSQALGVPFVPTDMVGATVPSPPAGHTHALQCLLHLPLRHIIRILSRLFLKGKRRSVTRMLSIPFSISGRG